MEGRRRSLRQDLRILSRPRASGPCFEVADCHPLSSTSSSGTASARCPRFAKPRSTTRHWRSSRSTSRRTEGSSRSWSRSAQPHEGSGRRRSSPGLRQLTLGGRGFTSLSGGPLHSAPGPRRTRTVRSSGRTQSSWSGVGCEAFEIVRSEAAPMLSTRRADRTDGAVARDTLDRDPRRRFAAIFQELVRTADWPAAHARKPRVLTERLRRSSPRVGGCDAHVERGSAARVALDRTRFELLDQRVVLLGDSGRIAGPRDRRPSDRTPTIGSSAWGRR